MPLNEHSPHPAQLPGAAQILSYAAMGTGRTVRVGGYSGAIAARHCRRHSLKPRESSAMCSIPM